MSTLTFDTYASMKKLQASGLPDTQAEAVLEVLRDAQDAQVDGLATKADLAAVKSDIAMVRSEIQIMEQRLVIKLGGLMAAMIATATGVILHFLK